jgi:hypothetical protein
VKALISAALFLGANLTHGAYKVNSAYIDFRLFSAANGSSGTCEGQTSKSNFIYLELAPRTGGTPVTVYTPNDAIGKNILAMALSATATGTPVEVGFQQASNCSPDGTPSNRVDYFVVVAP